MVPIRSAFSQRKRVVLKLAGVAGRAKQSFKKECDVNEIMRKFRATGVLPTGPLRSPEFGDVTGLNFQSMMDVIARANEMFASLPSHIRRRFSNEPREFVAFCEDKENLDELRKMGLAPRATVSEGAKVPPEGVKEALKEAGPGPGVKEAPKGAPG